MRGLTHSQVFVALVLLCFAGRLASADPPRGYFVDVQPVAGIDEGPWRDHMGSISADGLEIYFDSDYGADPQPPFGQSGPFRKLFIARRSSVDEPFGPREQLSFSVEGLHDNIPVLSWDGLTMTFDSARPAEPGGSVLNTSPSWMVTRESIDAPWSEPVPTIERLAVEGLEAINLQAPIVSRDGLEIIYESQADRSFDLFQATRESTDMPFHNVTQLDVNRATFQDDQAFMSFDGRVLFFSRMQLDWTLPEIRVAYRDSRDEPFDADQNIDQFSLGRRSPDRHSEAELVDFAAATWAPVVTPDWPAHGSKLYFSTTCCGDNYNIYQATWLQETPLAGDFTSDGHLDGQDLEIVSQAIRLMTNPTGFDLSRDGVVDGADRDHWVTVLAQTWYGDANLDGEFNSTDLVEVFQAGKYERQPNQLANATWNEGDWDGDGYFTSSDIVFAFEDGGYEQGPRGNVNAVPEPASGWMLIVSVWAVGRQGVRRKR